MVSFDSKRQPSNPLFSIELIENWYSQVVQGFLYDNYVIIEKSYKAENKFLSSVKITKAF
jgi:hypothetical protein